MKSKFDIGDFVSTIYSDPRLKIGALYIVQNIRIYIPAYAEYLTLCDALTLEDLHGNFDANVMHKVK